MIVMVTPKGWTGPKEVDGVQIEGTFRAHQVPLTELATKPGHLKMLETWMRSYRPEELFDDTGRPIPELRRCRPRGRGAWAATRTPTAVCCCASCACPISANMPYPYRRPAWKPPKPRARWDGCCATPSSSMPDNFRIFGPDETSSNRLDAVFEVTDRTSEAAILPSDDHVSPDGRVMEVLSEHMCQGWLEGYLLTGRHGFFSCYEAFIHIIDSMFNQHAKWLKVTRHIPWRPPIASLNYLLTSHVWRQDHNGFSHQDPGFIDHVVNKKAEVVRVYLPPDANTLLSVADHCLRSRNYVNVIVAGKQPALQWLDMDAAIAHCTAGAGIWHWAGTAGDGEPDVVMACAGDVPHARNTGRGRLASQTHPRFENTRRERRGSDGAPAAQRTSSRHDRRRIRRPVHQGPAHRLCLSRLSLADSSPDVSANESRQSARARIQGRGNHHHAVRYDGAERPGPVSPGGRRDRPRARSGGARASPRNGSCATNSSSTSCTSRATETICRRFAIGGGRKEPAAVAPTRTTAPAWPYLGDVHARVGGVRLPLRTACPEFRQALLRIGNQVEPARDLALRPAPQFQIALVEVLERAYKSEPQECLSHS